MHTTRSEKEQPAKRNPRPTKMYHACRDNNKHRRYVYYGENHTAVECNKITDLSDCRQNLLNKRASAPHAPITSSGDNFKYRGPQVDFSIYFQY